MLPSTAEIVSWSHVVSSAQPATGFAFPTCHEDRFDMGIVLLPSSTGMAKLWLEAATACLRSGSALVLASPFEPALQAACDVVAGGIESHLRLPPILQSWGLVLARL
eukprot:5708128-Amphidinium_carterae.1